MNNSNNEMLNLAIENNNIEVVKFLLKYSNLDINY